MKIMVSDPITSQQIDGEAMETIRDFIFLGSKITADGDGSHEIKNKNKNKKKTMRIYFRNKWFLEAGTTTNFDHSLNLQKYAIK